MTAADIAALLEQKFGPSIKSKNLTAIDPFVVVDAAAVLDVGRFLKQDDRLQFDLLNCISGVDYLEPDPKKAPKAGFDPHLEVVYHLSSFRHRHRFVVKVILPRWKEKKTSELPEATSPKCYQPATSLENNPGELPEVPSVTSLWATANWHEREVYDLSGVWFTGHPELTRILLADDWVGHPLRKDYEYPLEYHGIRGR
ncbi:MAG TPA: NADH-quinone oxidoreductase subunit C [Gemmataceae bacterium]|jgi:NADH-quinone oxidoreductase subunit C